MTSRAPVDPLAAIIGQTDLAVRNNPAAERWPWLFTRCWLRLHRFEQVDRRVEDLDAALADFDALPATAPGRAKLAAALVLAHLNGELLADHRRMPRVLALVAIAERDSRPLDGTRQTCAAVRALDLVYAISHGREGLTIAAARAEVDRLAEVVGRRQPQALLVERARDVLRHRDNVRFNDLNDVVAMREGIDDLKADVASEPAMLTRAELMQLALDGQAMVMRHDMTGATDVLRRLVAAAPALPEHDPLRRQITLTSQLLGAITAVTDPTRRGTAPAEAAKLRVLAEHDDLPPNHRALLLATANSVLLAGGVATPEALDRTVADLERVVALVSPEDPDRGFHLTQLGTALLMRYERAHRRDDLTLATSTLEEARRLAGSSAHVLWTMVSTPLARAYWLAGRTGVERAPVELRRQVLTTVVGISADSGDLVGDPASTLFDAPSIHEVRSALRALAADALVYLVPGPESAGFAVIVPADGRVGWLPLPGLDVGPGTPYARWAATPREDGPRPPDRDAGAVRAGALEALCDWAWDTAIGQLLGHHLLRSRRGPVKLVLVAMGVLSRVPWHAARRWAGARHRYAIEDAVFSYAVSARLLCEVARRRGVVLDETGLVVGDPDVGDEAVPLPAARVEAHAIRAAFYPRSRYIGRLPDGRCSPDGAGADAEVLAWLGDPDAGAMIHLACHGVVHDRTSAERGDSSYLLLAGADRLGPWSRRLSAESLLGALTAGTGRPIGLAVLACCSSGVSTRGYDEAFSIATTMLAGGACSVVSAQWAVPDGATSLLMYVFHHYLRLARLAPAEALRQAQLWMLGVRAAPLPDVPEALHARAAHVPAGLTAWAGFIHSGR
jgi:hypothetical protein